MTKRIIFFRGMIEIVDYFSESLEAAAAASGMLTLMLDVNRDKEYNRSAITEFANQQRCVVICFNNTLLTHIPDITDEGGEPLIAVYNILIDHPINYISTLLYPLKQYHIIAIDRDHERFIKRYYPNVKSLGFVPLGGTEEAGWLPYEKRDIDILYVGSCQFEPGFPAMPDLEDRGEDFYETVCRNMLEDSTLSTDASIRLWEMRSGHNLSPDDHIALYSEYGYLCEHWVRRYFKQEIMKVLSEAGINVDVYGIGWNNPDYHFCENIRFHEPVTPKVCSELSGRAKIRLNVMPWFKDGSHDRIHIGMLNGAVVVTDTSGYLKERFEHGRNIVFYDMSDITGLIHNLKWLLEHPVEAEGIASAGRVIAEENDSWSRRLEEILTLNFRE